ncbi:MAG: hypothetical protein ACREDF_05535, partial [Thermoplasmata archaeon]
MEMSVDGSIRLRPPGYGGHGRPGHLVPAGLVRRSPEGEGGSKPAALSATVARALSMRPELRVSPR